MSDWVCPNCRGGFPNEAVDNMQRKTGGVSDCPWCEESFKTFGMLQDD